MPDDHIHTAIPAEVQATRQEFYDRIDNKGMAPLWERMKGLVPAEPHPKSDGYIWQYDAIRPMMMEAGDLLTAEEAERRVLVLENPAFKGLSRATTTLYAGVQLVLPGEVAAAHRHTASALRFVLESKGGHTSVGGERTVMLPGDFVITPSWAWHDHGNYSDAPILWMDILDLPMVNFFEGGFSQHHNELEQSISRPENDALSRFGAGLLPIEIAPPYGQTSPIFNYPYSRTRPALTAIASAGDIDPHWGYTLKYANPLDGGWAMPTIASWMTHLPANAGTAPIRSTDGVIVAVAEGHGTAQIGDKRIAFGPRDIISVPNWTWRSFKADSDCFLFCSSDRVAQEKLGLWREERQSA